ncbi:chorismate pyruvate-lyase family protein [Pseudoalteromonas sp. Of7M-16]|uniref:chorismate--pyruvate lyase family protein n=1 Tax=Pseudoalteromonas sp. Of7M-16 TaxID=2917756 RepID=UPI001EF3F396|nr:chorismate pyruvate-lyase family protein [Pseudoalteromonas sp. Of7M-16]MCG7547821.1 chorismate pyruvate-lyase family protein [Pseudoalteromonas sp. Of7M-16]
MIRLSDESLCNLDDSLSTQAYNLSNLSYLQKIILGTDGTVTQLLESIVGEKIVVDKLLEAEVGVVPHEEEMHCQRRVITLNGDQTGLPYLYADSLVYHGNMNVNFSRALTETRIPIGKAWEKFQIETYKTLLAWGFEYANELSQHFAIEPKDLVLYRTYIVYSQGRKIFRITEKFPLAWYMQSEQFDNQFATPELSTLVSGI